MNLVDLGNITCRGEERAGLMLHVCRREKERKRGLRTFATAQASSDPGCPEALSGK